MNNVFKVAVVESERDWGSKIDDYMVCLTIEDAKSFIEEFNSENNLSSVPDWYMYAEDVPVKFQISEKQYNNLKRLGRMWFSSLKKII